MCKGAPRLIGRGSVHAYVFTGDPVLSRNRTMPLSQTTIGPACWTPTR